MFDNFKWFNQCEIICDSNNLCMQVNDYTDMFCSQNGKDISSNAAFYYTELEGDCIIRAKVSMQPNGRYDGVGLMIYSDQRHWIKGCLEVVFNGKLAAISVATNEISDDAIGPYADSSSIWLQVCRKDKQLAVHFSTDGKTFELIRICRIDMANSIKIGMIGQAPTGQGGKRMFENVELYNKPIADIRSGNID